MAFVVGGARKVGDEPKTIDLPTVRLFTVTRGYAETPQKDCGGQWAVSTRQAAIHFSAVGYFFGRALHEKLGVPIGLINTSVSGTPAELWTSQEGLAADPALKSFIETPAQRERRLAREVDIVAKYKAALAQWQKDAAAAKAAGKTPPRRPGQPRTGRRISSLYYAMVAPLTRFRVAGVIWYQGEANAHSVRSALLYAKLFPAMIRDWRAKWGYELPFLFVQLANFRSRSPEPTDTAWARIRESQKKTLALPKTGMAVIIDIGERGNVHAKDKQDVGRRLALAARAIVYGEKDLVYSGPMYNSMKVEGGKVVLSFDHLGSGLMIGPPEGAITAGPDQAPKVGAEKLVGFAVAGADGKFVWADAKIVGDTVVVGSPEVEKPVAVRYGWDNDPACNLYNKEGLPASPFRTDNWKPGGPTPAVRK